MFHTISPGQLARAIGVSESSVKRWIDAGELAAQRTMGGHRRISIPDAVAFIRASGATIVQPDAIGIQTPDDLPPRWMDEGDVGTMVHSALEQGDGPRARQLIQALYLAGWAPSEIFDGPVTTALRTLGELWLHADWGIAVEHRATNIVIHALGQLRGVMKPVTGDAPAAVGCSLSDDPYMIASMMVSTICAQRGLLDVNLGPVTPMKVLRNAVEHYRARCAWISVSATGDAAATAEEIAAFGPWAAARGCGVFIGGRILDQLPRREFSGVTICATMNEFENHLAQMTI